jgi:hypothetical protein
MRWLLAPLLALCCLPGTAAFAWVAKPPPEPKAAPRIWFNPNNPVDWLNVFQDDAPWPNAMTKTRIMTLEPSFLRTATDAQILAIADFLKTHHMEFEFDVEVVTKYPADACASGIEGYRFLSEIIPIFQNLKRLNVDVAWLHMDEPVWFGHYASGTCQFSLPTLIDRAVTMLDGILAIYPNIKIVEIEPIPDVMQFSDWMQSLSAFRLGVTRRTGQPIRGIITDVNWENPGWQSAMAELNTWLHQQNLDLGIIYNGTADDPTAADWINDAVNNFETTEGALGIIPAEAIFSSWNTFPTYDMPETSPTAQTWLIDRYSLPRSRLSVQWVGHGVKGRLTNDQDRPIANATVVGRVPGVDLTKQLPTVVVQGTVPATAGQAIIGFRLNQECRCQGVNDVLLGTVAYQETHGGSAAMTYAYPNSPYVYFGVITGGETVGGVVVTRIIAQANQPFGGNSPMFQVTPGATFQFTVPAATIAGEGWYGNVIIIWMDQNGNGISRVIVTPGAGEATVATAVTAADGTFALPALPTVRPSSAPAQVYYDGAGIYRSVTWTPMK